MITHLIKKIRAHSQEKWGLAWTWDPATINTVISVAYNLALAALPYSYLLFVLFLQMQSRFSIYH